MTKNLDNYKGTYLVSTLLGVYRITNNKGLIKINPYIANNGYLTIGLSYKGVKRVFLFHRLMAMNFLPNPNNHPCVNHIDGNKLNNDLSNLEWCTYSKNNKHAYKNGLKKAPYNNAKINKSIADNIRKLKSNGVKSIEIATTYKLSVSNINAIIRGLYW